MLKMTALFFLGAAAMLSLAYAAQSSSSWKPLHASYTIFSGQHLANRSAPTPADRKLAITLEGKTAKELFDSIGPDQHPTCSQEKGDRDRRKRGVQCTYSPEENSNGYRCWIGIDLQTGESIPVVAC